jgi:tetratricopeptide (TPR) repeat protein
MRGVRWGVAVGGSFVVLAVVRLVSSGGVHLHDAASWAVASAAAAAALSVLGWWASREEAPSPGGGGAALAAMASGSRSQAVVGDVGAVIGAGARLRGATIMITAPAGEGRTLAPARAESAGAVVVGDVPGRPVAFQGREGLLGALRGRGDGAGISVVHAVTGMRGVGKTQLAAECARRCIGEGWRLVAWVSADTAATTLDGLARAAVAVGVPAGATQEETAAGFRHWLESHGARCLVVFDNADDPDVIRPYLPAAGEARVVITSTSETVTGLGRPVPIDVFSDAEALAYLCERTGLRDEAGAGELATELGNLPLALAQAAAVIKGQSLGYPAYLGRLRALPVGEYLARPREDPYPHGAAAAILLALDAAYATGPTSLARPLINLLAWLSPAGVARALLHSAHDSGALTPEAAPAGVPAAQPAAVAGAQVDTALAHLSAASLLTFARDGTSVTVHRLTARVLREQALHQGTLATTVTAAITLLRAATEATDPVWRHQQTARDLIQHVIALHDHLRQLPGEPGRSITEQMLGLRGWALWCQNELADNPVQAIVTGRDLVADRERVLGADHPDTLTSRNNLAYAYQSAGRLGEAVPLYERTLADYERVLGADHPHTLTSRNNLAYAYRAAGRLGEAVPLFERALADRERVLGGDHPDTLNSRNNLAYAYRAVGRLDEAEPLFERALADSERIHGAGHSMTRELRDTLDELRRRGRG